MKEEIIFITDGNRKLVLESLDKGKIVDYCAYLGPSVEEALKKGYHDKVTAKIKLIDAKVPNNAICGCQKPANIIVRFWR